MPFEIVKAVDDAEKPQCDVECLDVHGDYLFSSSEGGKIKVWKTEDMSCLGELDPGQAGLTCILAHGERLYAGMAGGSIVVFDVASKAVINELKGHESGVMVLRHRGDVWLSGDAEGKIFVWENDTIVNKYETCEELWDLALLDEYLYSIRDRDLTIQKIVATGHGKKLTVNKCLPGRAPLCRFDGKLAMLTRDGMDIQVFEDDHREFKQLAVIKGAHELMLNTLACSPLAKLTTHLYSGGWDGIVRAYNLKTYSVCDSIKLDQPVNTIKVDPAANGYVYVGGNSGLLVKLKHN